jgi:glycosyltransferase involved in cell wall biosynthesis
MTRVTHLTTVHPPDDGRIFHKEANTLADAGYDVTLVAPRVPASSEGQVRLVNVPVTDGSRVRRALSGNYQLLRLLAAERADVYHFHDPELMPIGLALRAMRRRVIYDAHEHVRDTIRNKTDIPAPLRTPVRVTVGVIEKVMARVATGVVAATPTIAAQFPTSHTIVVHNYPILDAVPSADFTVDDYLQRTPTGVYIGIMTKERKSNEMFLACDNLQREVHEFRLTTAGKTHEVDDPATHSGIDYRGFVNREEAMRLLADARFGVMLLGAGPNGTDGMPTKFFEYCAAGLPVVVSRSTVNIARIVEHERCGILVDETSSEDVGMAMRQLLDDPIAAYEMGQRGADAIRTKYGWESEGRRLVSMYTKFVGAPDAEARQ